MDFLKNLVKRVELRESGHKPIFNNEETKTIKTYLKAGTKRFDLRGKTFLVRYFRHNKEDWVTVRPTEGFVPMFSAPFSEATRDETII